MVRITGRPDRGAIGRSSANRDYRMPTYDNARKAKANWATCVHQCTAFWFASSSVAFTANMPPSVFGLSHIEKASRMNGPTLRYRLNFHQAADAHRVKARDTDIVLSNENSHCEPGKGSRDLAAASDVARRARARGGGGKASVARAQSYRPRRTPDFPAGIVGAREEPFERTAD